LSVHFYLLTESYELCAFYHLQVGGEFCCLQAIDSSFDTTTKGRIHQLRAAGGSQQCVSI